MVRRRARVDRAAARRALGSFAPIIACAVLYLAALEVGAALRFSDGFAALWPANAVLLATLMLTRPRRWWLYLLAVIPAHFAAYEGNGTDAMRLAWQVAHNGVLCLAAAAFLRVRVASRYPFGSMRDLTAYLLVVVLILPAIAALGAPGTLSSAFGSMSSGAASPWTTWRFTWLANAINFLALVPALVLWGAYGRRWLGSADLARFAEAAAIATLAVAVCVVAFAGEPSSPAALYVLLVPLLWASARFGAAGVASVHFVMVLVTTALVARSGGSRAMEDVFDLQMFLVFLSLPMLILAVLMDERGAAAAELRENTDALRAIERSLRESNERFQLVLRATNDVIFDWNIAEETLWWSANGNRYLGPHVENRRYDLGWWSMRMHPSDRERVTLDLREAIERRDDVWEAECRFLQDDGTEVHIHARGLITRDLEGRPRRMIGSLVNVTDRKRLEEAHRRLAHAGRLMIAGELAASIAHEINQPLTAILNNAEAGLKLLESYPELDLPREILEDIRRDDVRASEVIARLRSWLRDRKLSSEPVDFNEVVRDVVRLLRQEAVRRGVRIETKLCRVAMVRGDQVHLQQVLMNLLVNGMDAMAETPEAKRRLVVRTACDGGIVKASVTDAGCGIPRNRLPSLFESFYTSKADGMGLGLSIARSIVHAHGGRICAGNNAEGAGATFALELPASMA